MYVCVICNTYVCGSVLTERERGEETRHSGRTENGTALMGQHDPWQNREWNGFCGTGIDSLCLCRFLWVIYLYFSTLLCFMLEDISVMKGNS